jgi:mRNA interferase RelE/StbE
VKYKVEFSEEAQDQLSLIPKGEAKKIVKRAEKLADAPFPPKCEKLEGSDGIYRVRQGDYRILYSVIEKKLVVLVLKIGHRREVYR